MSAGDSNQYPAVQGDAAAELHDAVARPRWLLDEKSSPEEIAILQAMTGQQRLKVAEQMFWEARNKIEQEVRSEHPDWNVEEINWEIFRRLDALDV